MTTTIVGGVIGVAGVILGAALTWLQQTLAARAAAKVVAAALFTQVVKAITLMETEQALFRHRRTSKHANFIALANVAVKGLAGRASGRGLAGFADGLGDMTAWDAAEGARFSDRYVAARAEVTTAIVQLSLMSDGLQKACADLSDALGVKTDADGKRGDGAEKADAEVQKALGRLRAAVAGYRG